MKKRIFFSFTIIAISLNAMSTTVRRQRSAAPQQLAMKATVASVLMAQRIAAQEVANQSRTVHAAEWYEVANDEIRALCCCAGSIFIINSCYKIYQAYGRYENPENINEYNMIEDA